MLQCQLFKLKQGGLAAQGTVNIWKVLGSSQHKWTTSFRFIFKQKQWLIFQLLELVIIEFLSSNFEGFNKLLRTDSSQPHTPPMSTSRVTRRSALCKWWAQMKAMPWQSLGKHTQVSHAWMATFFLPEIITLCTLLVVVTGKSHPTGAWGKALLAYSSIPWVLMWATGVSVSKLPASVWTGLHFTSGQEKLCADK